MVGFVTDRRRDCAVFFRCAHGHQWQANVCASSTHEAVRKAWEWFHDDHWRGPKPTLDTVFRVSIICGEGEWFVRARRVLGGSV